MLDLDSLLDQAYRRLGQKSMISLTACKEGAYVFSAFPLVPATDFGTVSTWGVLHNYVPGRPDQSCLVVAKFLLPRRFGQMDARQLIQQLRTLNGPFMTEAQGRLPLWLLRRLGKYRRRRGVPQGVYELACDVVEGYHPIREVG